MDKNPVILESFISEHSTEDYWTWSVDPKFLDNQWLLLLNTATENWKTGCVDRICVYKIFAWWFPSNHKCIEYKCQSSLARNLTTEQQELLRTNTWPTIMGQICKYMEFAVAYAKHAHPKCVQGRWITVPRYSCSALCPWNSPGLSLHNRGSCTQISCGTGTGLWGKSGPFFSGANSPSVIIGLRIVSTFL